MQTKNNQSFNTYILRNNIINTRIIIILSSISEIFVKQIFTFISSSPFIKIKSGNDGRN